MAIVLALLSALIYGVSDYLGGRVSRRVSPVALTLIGEVTMLLGLLVIIPLVEDDAPSASAVAWGLAAGTGASLGVLGLYAALSRGNMTVVAPVTGVVAAVVPVGVGVALGERPSVLGTSGIVLAVVAVALIGGIVGAAHQHVDLATVLLAVVVGLAFGLMFIAYSLTGDDSGLWPLLAARFGGVPLLAAIYTVQRGRGRIPAPGRGVVGPGVAIGVLVGLANALYLLSTREGLLSIVAVLVSLYPASTVLLAMVLDHERASRSQLVGMGMAVVGVVAITLGS